MGRRGSTEFSLRRRSKGWWVMIRRRFNDYELEALEMDLSHTELAQRLGRTAKSIATARSIRGIYRLHHYWSPVEDQQLRQIWELGWGFGRRAERALGRTPGACYTRAAKLGLIRRSKNAR
jgi:hypothetical protein